jgi:high-affinity nickel-transport protein
MTDTSLTAALGIGFLLGLRHAADADHIAAVSTLVSETRSVARSCVLGTFWGAGHTLALVAAGLLTIGFRVTISPELERSLEALVAVVLVALGGHVLLRSLASGGGGHGHVHVLRAGRRPFLVGLVHGLAGSAALMLLVLASIPSPLGGLLYIATFGIGATAGMLVLSGILAVPFVLTAGRSETINLLVRLGAGAVSLAFGLWLLWGQAP